MAFRNRVVELSQLVADEVIGAIIQTDTLSPYVKMWKDTLGRNRIDFVISGLNSFAKGSIFATGEDGVSNPALFLASPDNNAVAPDQAQAILRAGDLTAAAFSGYPEFDANTAEGRFKYLRTFGIAWLDSLRIGGNGSNKAIQDLDCGNQGATNTNGSSQITINHDLGAVPSVVIWTDNAGNSPYIGRHVTSADTNTSFKIEFRRSDTNALSGAGVSVGGSWIAIA